MRVCVITTSGEAVLTRVTVEVGFFQLISGQKEPLICFHFLFGMTIFKEGEKRQREPWSSGMCTNTFSILAASSVLLLKVRSKEINTPQPKRLEISNKGQFYTEPSHLALFGKLIFLKQEKFCYKHQNQSYFVLWEC